MLSNRQKMKIFESIAYDDYGISYPTFVRKIAELYVLSDERERELLSTLTDKIILKYLNKGIIKWIDVRIVKKYIKNYIK